MDADSRRDERCSEFPVLSRCNLGIKLDAGFQLQSRHRIGREELHVLRAPEQHITQEPVFAVRAPLRQLGRPAAFTPRTHCGGHTGHYLFNFVRRHVNASQRMTNGSPMGAPAFSQIVFVCRYSSTASAPFSRPIPLRL
jgi:hypothetical protein